MEMALDHIRLVDNHCHGLWIDQDLQDPVRWRRMFTESFDPEMPKQHIVHALHYQRMIQDLARFFGCPPDETEVLRCRADRDGTELIRDLLTDAGLDALLLDQGLPPRDVVRPDREITEATGVRTYPLLRLELLMEDLILAESSLERVEERLGADLQDIRGRGYVGLKSIVAYRTGLAIARSPREEVEAAFREAREEGKRDGRLRIHQKPLLDHLLLLAFEEASHQEVPLQFHTGYGDTDTDLRLGNPLLLRAVFEDPAFKAMPVVLLHESYPYTRESAYLSAVYKNVYTDLSYGIPFLGFEEMAVFTRAALGVAPASKLLYSSDAVGIPELHWSSAIHGRRAISRVLGQAVELGECTVARAEAMGERILRQNAIDLYGLGDLVGEA